MTKKVDSERKMLINDAPQEKQMAFRKNPLNNQEEDMVSVVSVKEQMTHIIQDQPEDSSYEEILKELAFALMIDRGLADSRAGRTISHDEMKRRLVSWQS